MSSTPQPVMRGEVWFVRLDPVEGHEQGGERPCLVVSNNQLNQSGRGLVWVIPITSQERSYPTRIPLADGEAGTTKQSWVIGEQIRCVSKGRLRRRCGDVAPNTMTRVQEMLRLLLALDARM